MSALAALKAKLSNQKSPDTVLTKLTKGQGGQANPVAQSPFVGFVSDPLGGFEKVESVETRDKHDREYDERAAIMHHDGGLPVGWADGFATLLSCPPPVGLKSADWQANLDRALIFADKYGDELNALGWAFGDIFPVTLDFRQWHQADVANGPEAVSTDGRRMALTATFKPVQNGVSG